MEDSNNDEYKFKAPLIRATILKRNSQFTATVSLNGKEMTVHVPNTGRIGDVNLTNVPCLLSYHKNKKRKYKYDIEAVLLSDDDNWVGINQILSNKLVQYFLETNQLSDMIDTEDSDDSILREVKLGNSVLDFKVGNIYIEVKTPLMMVSVKYGKNIKIRPKSPNSSTERFTKHIKELAESLKKEERAILLIVNQYRVTEKKEFQNDAYFKKVKKVIKDSIKKGIEIWNLELNFAPEGVSIHQLKETTDEILKLTK
jgi:sugar fermentation stimulation protein A